MRAGSASVKIIVDPAFFGNNGTYSHACVAGDAAGEFIEAKSCCREGSPAPELAEAMGVREALSWIKKKGWNRAIIESDCITLVQSIRSKLLHDFLLR